MSRPPDVTLTQLRYFVEAATFSSMTVAASHLHIAQSAVSAAVAQLERQIGTQVFVRQRARGLVLTTAGEELLRDARSVLGHLAEVLDTARGHGEQVRGTVHLACFVTLAPFVLPELLSDISARHPLLDLEVTETEAESAHGALRSGAVEIAITYDLGLGAEVHREVLAVVRPHVVLPSGHRLARRSAVALRDLADEPMIVLDLPRSREYFEAVVASTGQRPTVRYRSSSYETVRGLVASGHGFSVLHQRPHDDATYSGGRVTTRPIADDVPSLDVVLARLAAVRPTARSRAVADSARRVLARHHGAPDTPGDPGAPAAPQQQE